MATIDRMTVNGTSYEIIDSSARRESCYGMKLFEATDRVFDGSWSGTSVQGASGYLKNSYVFSSESEIAGELFKFQSHEYIPALQQQNETVKLAIWIETADEDVPTPVIIRLTSGTNWSPEESVAEGTATFTKTGVYLVDLKYKYFVQAKTMYAYIAVEFNGNKNGLAKIGVMQVADNFVNYPLLSIPVLFIPGAEPIGISNNISNMAITKNTITVESTAASSYFSLKNIKFSAGQKYAFKIDYTPRNADGKMTVKSYRAGSGWKADLASYAQTAGVSITDAFIFAPTDEDYGELGFDLPNSVGCTHEIQIQIFDVTALDDDVLQSIDFSKISDTGILLNPVFFASKTSAVESSDLSTSKVIFYGDSITAQNLYPPMVANYFGFSYVNRSVGGSKIAYENENSFSSDTRIAGIPSDADVVIIMGGTNDWDGTEIESTLVYNNGFDRTKFKGALAYTIQHIQQTAPNARIIIATNIGGRGQREQLQPLPQLNNLGLSPLDYRNAEIEVGSELNIEVCDTWSCGINGFNRLDYIADTVHPNFDGAKLIADYMIHYLK